MTRKEAGKHDPSDEMNIRSPEERYGGEGHAGTDPFARPRPGRDRTGEGDSHVEMPNATVDDLVQEPASAPERARDDSGTPGGPADPKIEQSRANQDNT
jgi:hypothetical protein